MVVEDEGDETSEPPKLCTNRSSARPSPPSNWLTNFHRDLVAGALMGGVVHTIVAPIERAKLLLQTQESNVAIVAGHTGARTVREEGIFSLWRGNGSSVLRYYPSVALNFSFKIKDSSRSEYLASRKTWEEKLVIVNGIGTRGIQNIINDEVSYNGQSFIPKDLYRNILRAGNYKYSHLVSGASANFIAGAAAGCTTLVIIYPLDIAHTRLAADLGNSESRQFRGICHFLSTIREKEGLRGIYRGLPASLHGMLFTGAFTSEVLIL
ncbi:hypothetical protein RJ639_017325 [Escallonia herrerae]|uniref:ADP/ATP translocase n=1 Tax=Escallonia herrerae TaxID=1293975 RepID=A0AA88VE40_9ASTE|nr:hypothetical protein RJ639_017325 [Escallonia herrerae]